MPLPAATYLYLSPHLDDVALSIGGLVHKHSRAGARAVIATFCTGDAPPERSLGPLASEFHAKWGGSASAYAERRREDADACARLGAEHRHLGLRDAIYRAGGADAATQYQSFDQLFGPPADWDAEFRADAVSAIGRLVEELGPAVVYGPLAAGGHVDHRHVLHSLGPLRGAHGVAVRLYEDQPYSAGVYPPGCSNALEIALRACPFDLLPQIEAVDFPAKTAAIRCYRSQLQELFGPDLAALSALESYARSLTGGRETAERVWQASL